MKTNGHIFMEKEVINIRTAREMFHRMNMNSRDKKMSIHSNLMLVLIDHTLIGVFPLEDQVINLISITPTLMTVIITTLLSKSMSTLEIRKELSQLV